jgi:hypothetical protein
MADEAQLTDALCPSWATGVGYMGVAAAVVLSNWGSAVRHNCHCARDRIAFGFLSGSWQHQNMPKSFYCTMESFVLTYATFLNRIETHNFILPILVGHLEVRC